MTLRRNDTKDEAVIELAGALTVGGPVEALKRAVLDVLARGYRRVRLNVRGVPYADASGLGALVECRKEASAAGARLILEGTRGKLRELVKLFGLRLDAAPATVLARDARRSARAARSLAGAHLRCRVA